MAVILGILAFLVVYGGPVALGAWAGSQSKIPWQAFIMGWIITPLSAFLLGLALETIAYSMNPGKSGGGLLVIVLPVIGVWTGLVAGIVAYVVSHRRLHKAPPTANPDDPR